MALTRRYKGYTGICSPLRVSHPKLSLNSGCRDALAGSGKDCRDRDCIGDRLPCKRVVCIDGDALLGHVDDGHQAGFPHHLHFEELSGNRFAIEGQLLALYRDHEFPAKFSVGLLRRQHYGHRLTRLSSDQCLLKQGVDLLLSKGHPDWLTCSGILKDLTVWTGAGEVQEQSVAVYYGCHRCLIDIRFVGPVLKLAGGMMSSWSVLLKRARLNPSP